MMALRQAERTGQGQVVDVALSESVFSMLEAIVPEYGYDGRVRERTGNLLGGAAPYGLASFGRPSGPSRFERV